MRLRPFPSSDPSERARTRKPARQRTAARPQSAFLIAAAFASLPLLSDQVHAAPLDFSRPLKTPYARREPLGIRGLTITPRTVPVYGRVELTVDFTATYDNPFDAGDVTVDARIISPTRKQHDVPGFYYQPFRRELKDGAEVLTPSGEPSWRIRFCPKEPGIHQVTIRVHDRTGAGVMSNRSFLATASPSPGMVRVSPRDSRYFEFENGKPYFPVGANTGRTGPRGTFDFDDWFSRLRKAGSNYVRLSLSPHGSTFALERPGKTAEGRGMGQFDLANAWRLDHVLDTAAAQGLYLTLTVEQANILSDQPSLSPEWHETPHNARNGGPLNRPTDFWTNDAMEGLYLNKLRYLVARYGASSNLLAWELWNEVDLTSGYRTEPVKAWHAKMIEHLRKQDPYDHLITTSFSRQEGDPAIETLPGIDFVQTHLHGGPDLPAGVRTALQMKARYKKPHFVTEVAAVRHEGSKEQDSRRLQLHNPLWASLAGGASGGAAPGAWDRDFLPSGVEDGLTPAARLAREIDWPDEKLRAAGARVEWLKRPRGFPRANLTVPGVPGTWAPSIFNRPRTVIVTSAGVSGEAPISGIQHGIQSHAALRNPVTFEVDLPRETRFVAEIGGVSGDGGGVLRISLDGKPVLERDFADTDQGTMPLRQYAGPYGVQVPAGKHTLVVENVGRDWFEASYRFLDAVERRAPALDSWASVGEDLALAWVRLEDLTWRHAAGSQATPTPVPPSRLVIPGLAAGKWTAEFRDTWSGQVRGKQPITVSKAGEARILLPTIHSDLAVILRRQAAAPKSRPRKP